MNKPEITRRYDDRLILALRDRKNTLDPDRPYNFLVEKERRLDGNVDKVLTIFLANSECPFRCLMCDLWRNTLDDPLQPGSIPQQIRWALDRLDRIALDDVNRVKVYNNGNFFDTRAIPTDDYEEIAELLSRFEVVTVECHPKLINSRTLEFSNMLSPKLEIAMGLETVHPKILPMLNKGMLLEDFEQSVELLINKGIGTRAFILIKTPFMTESMGVEWAQKSIDFAFESGVEICVVIPTRAGNGIMDQLKQKGDFSEPNLSSMEEVLSYGIGSKKGMVFADLWDLEKFSECEHCFESRRQRLEQMNLSQTAQEPIKCDQCRS